MRSDENFIHMGQIGDAFKKGWNAIDTGILKNPYCPKKEKILFNEYVIGFRNRKHFEENLIKNKLMDSSVGIL
jgi:hypothetical protein